MAFSAATAMVPTKGYRDSGMMNTRKQTPTPLPSVTWDKATSDPHIQNLPTLLHKHLYEEQSELIHCVRTKVRFDNRRDIPLFDIRLPEFGAFSSRSDRLIPGALSGDADVARQEEREHSGNLRSNKENSHIWARKRTVWFKDQPANKRQAYM